MRKLMALVLVAAGVLCAQERRWQQKVYDVRNTDAQALARLVQSVMRDRETRVVENVALKAVSVGSYDAADLQAAEELIRRFDVAGAKAPGDSMRNIEITAYMLLAGKSGQAGEAVPKELEPVVKQLKSVFGYGDFQLLETALMRVREGISAETSGNAGTSDPALSHAPTMYQIRFKMARIENGERGRLVRLDGFRFSIRVPYAMNPAPPPSSDAPRVAPLVNTQYGYSEVGFNTELDLKEGQKVVVGKSKVNSGGSAFILVLTAQAVD